MTWNNSLDLCFLTFPSGTSNWSFLECALWSVAWLLQVCQSQVCGFSCSTGSLLGWLLKSDFYNLNFSLVSDISLQGSYSFLSFLLFLVPFCRILDYNTYKKHSVNYHRVNCCDTSCWEHWLQTSSLSSVLLQSNPTLPSPQESRTPFS